MSVDVFDFRYQKGSLQEWERSMAEGCHTSADAKAKEESRHYIDNRTSSSNTEP